MAKSHGNNGNNNTIWVLDARRETPELMQEVKMRQMFQMVDIAATRFINIALALKIAELRNNNKRIALKKDELADATKYLNETARKTDEIRRAFIVMTREIERDIARSRETIANIEDHENTTEEFELLCIKAADLVRAEQEL